MKLRGLATGYLAAFALAACGSQPPPPVAGPVAGPVGGPIRGGRIAGEAAEMDTVVMLSPAVANSIGVTATAGKRGAVGNLECIARLLNRTPAPLVVQARATYYDGDAMPIDDQTAFKTVTLPANGEAGIKFESTSTAAAHYVIEIGELQ